MATSKSFERADLSAQTKNTLISKADDGINDFGKSARFITKGSADQDTLHKTAVNFASHEDLIQNTFRQIESMNKMMNDFGVVTERLERSVCNKLPEAKNTAANLPTPSPVIQHHLQQMLQEASSNSSQSPWKSQNNQEVGLEAAIL
eukprot:TRINITY_DN9127_c0_g1_i1.p1 TRINITY_DN9127_c0_g1~~TRINITY_DN9127_c0_g1_i1.p1  ORF type:complete len:147 (+),score=31.36 TRINITY_DN9127_c0_g1_i1:29-469(+)